MHGYEHTEYPVEATTNRALVILAPSGAGKTTLVEALKLIGYNAIDADVLGHRDEANQWIIPWSKILGWLLNANKDIIAFGLSHNWKDLTDSDHLDVPVIAWYVPPDIVGQRGVRRDRRELRRVPLDQNTGMTKDVEYYRASAEQFYRDCETLSIPLFTSQELIRCILEFVGPPCEDI
jgi:energy-coupling factor transporter ATP-binding protein EcfA2